MILSATPGETSAASETAGWLQSVKPSSLSPCLLASNSLEPARRLVSKLTDKLHAKFEILSTEINQNKHYEFRHEFLWSKMVSKVSACFSFLDRGGIAPFPGGVCLCVVGFARSERCSHLDALPAADLGFHDVILSATPPKVGRVRTRER